MKKTMQLFTAASETASKQTTRQPVARSPQQQEQEQGSDPSVQGVGVQYLLAASQVLHSQAEAGHRQLFAVSSTVHSLLKREGSGRTIEEVLRVAA